MHATMGQTPADWVAISHEDNVGSLQRARRQSDDDGVSFKVLVKGMCCQLGILRMGESESADWVEAWQR